MPAFVLTDTRETLARSDRISHSAAVRVVSTRVPLRLPATCSPTLQPCHAPVAQDLIQPMEDKHATTSMNVKTARVKMERHVHSFMGSTNAAADPVSQEQLVQRFSTSVHRSHALMALFATVLVMGCSLAPAGQVSRAIFALRTQMSVSRHRV